MSDVFVGDEDTWEERDTRMYDHGVTGTLRTECVLWEKTLLGELLQDVWGAGSDDIEAAVNLSDMS